MIVREVRAEEKEIFNRVVTHPLQSWQWGEFREKTGLKVIRIATYEEERLTAGFQLTFHPLPKTSYTVGYLPKCLLPNDYVLSALKKIGQENHCLFIKFEPNVGAIYQGNQGLSSAHEEIETFLSARGCVHGRPLFTKYTFYIDLKKSQAELLASLKPKTRYNLRLAQRYGVTVTEDNSDAAFQKHLELTFKTARRQKFYAHDENYHRLMWQTLRPAGMARLLKATYQNQILVTWLLFVFHNTLYYPYGASSSKHREVMASNLMMWEAMGFGKKIGCQNFDLWGSLDPNPNPKDPWFGFHHFKLGYNPTLIGFVGSFDLVINQSLYKLYNFADNLRWKWLKFKANLPC